MELALLKHIKPRQIKLLQEVGIDSVEALAMSSPSDIGDIEGMSDKAAKQLIWDSRDALNLTTFKNVAQLRENFEYITTGSKNLDTILHGGISTGRITEVFGAFKSGKTNLSHTLCVTTQLPKAQGGLAGAVLFIDTENTFSKSKIERIAKRFGTNVTTILSNIYHARIFSTDHQLQMVRAAEQAIREKNAKLVIVDSLMALMRSEYIGIGMLAARQQVLNKLIHDLGRIAETYNIAVVVTNQVCTVMKGTFSADDAIGGNIVAHGCHYRLQFKAKGFSANTSLERTATIVDAPDLPPDVASFFITEAGIADTEEVEYADGSKAKRKASSDSESEEVAPPLIASVAIHETPAEVISDPLPESIPDLIEIPDPLEAVEQILAKSPKANKKTTKVKAR